MPFDEDLAGVRFEEAAHHGDGGGLSGTVRAEESVDLTSGDVEADAIDGADRTERFGEPVDFEQSHRVDDGAYGTGVSEASMSISTREPMRDQPFEAGLRTV
jgi:hypothetical protein